MQVKFLYGENLSNRSDVNIKPGTIYLDIATGELYFDDPSKTNVTVNDRHKIIDTATLTFLIDEGVDYPSLGEEDRDIVSN